MRLHRVVTVDISLQVYVSQQDSDGMSLFDSNYHESHYSYHAHVHVVLVEYSVCVSHKVDKYVIIRSE